jgi:hypothetical protein
MEVNSVTPEKRAVGAVLAGGSVGRSIGGPAADTGHTGTPSGSIVQRSAAGRGAAAGRWPDWARRQLAEAVELAEGAPDDVGLARLLYREWFSPLVDAAGLADRRPLVAQLRAAHAGSGHSHRSGEVRVVDRFDVLGPDGWWRTWGRAWRPPRHRRGSVRLVLTPRRDAVTELVSTLTGALLPTDVAWSLGCAARPVRLARLGGLVLDLPSLDSMPRGVLDAAAGLVHPVAPPLTLPLRPGIGLAGYPDNGMSFGEHRCHLVALGLRHPSGGADPLRAIAAVFAAHGIDPALPYATASC